MFSNLISGLMFNRFKDTPNTIQKEKKSLIHTDACGDRVINIYLLFKIDFKPNVGTLL